MLSPITFVLPSILLSVINHAISWNPKRTKSHSLAALTAKMFRGGSIETMQPEEKKRLVLLIDVDNTLYSEIELLEINIGNPKLDPSQRGIESQIVRNTHLFGRKYFNLTSHECDELYRSHGSTIEGIRHLIPQNKVKEVLSRFYKEVYDPIDFTCLFANGGDDCRSGYDHGNALQKRRDMARFLKAICNKRSVYLTSNSPRDHVVRVLNGLGLRNINFAGILTPDSVEDQETVPFPTKSSPLQYYRSIIDRHPIEKNNIVLLDDSMNNIHAAESIGIRGIHIGEKPTNNSSRTLEEGISEALGHISDKKTYTFSDVQYLEAKNRIDFESINPEVWLRLADELVLRSQEKNELTLKIADLGAGMLSMLELIFRGGGTGDRAKLSLLSLIYKSLGSRHMKYGDPSTFTTRLEYYAYETNESLFRACENRLEKLGFEKHLTKRDTWIRRLVALQIPFEHANSIDGVLHSTINVDVIVHLRSIDFNGDDNPPNDLDLIIGCCFADLFDPDHLTRSLLRMLAKPGRNQLTPLAYFPITFSGITQFSPSKPASGACPSDTSAFKMYSDSLKRHGHSLDPLLLVNSIQNHGGSLIAQGQSKWIINPTSDAYLWETMLYFFGMSGGMVLLQNGVDAASWIERCQLNRRPIVVSNVDLLFRLGTSTKLSKSIQESDSNVKEQVNPNSADSPVQEIQFIAPYNVTTVRKENKLLEPNQVQIESICSLISSGTELKVFKGMFESAALDVNIKGMAEESMEYPLSYGYSLVGRVTACGADVQDSDTIIGKLVFVFAPHSSRVIVERGDIQLIPDGIEAEDAIFMPSVETALSLVHDAHVRLGENVAVYGQGLIGLLVTSILSMQLTSAWPSQVGSITTFDTLDDRLKMSNMMGATSALHPSLATASASEIGGFDVSIEVSGNPKALQSAIDSTSNEGRVIVGSWYGNSEVTLKLGIDFHRSHKTIQTSQVSVIPCALTGLWDKERRFTLTWELVKAILPSRLISKRLTLDNAQHAYELLDKGQEIAICFKY